MKDLELLPIVQSKNFYGGLTGLIKSRYVHRVKGQMFKVRKFKELLRRKRLSTAIYKRCELLLLTAMVLHKSRKR